MKKLTDDELRKFTYRINVDSEAVKKFLTETLDESVGRSQNIMKAENEMTLFRWNTSTINAIRDGINYAYYDY